MTLGYASALHIAHLAAALIGVGILLVLIGLLHTTPALNSWDARIFSWLHIRLRRYSGFFSYLWPLGTTPVGIILILIIFIKSWQAGLNIALAYLLIAILEWIVKYKVNRPRPFENLSWIMMNQPKKPHDPSHPSGDTMRVWFLALVFPLAFGLSWPAYALTGILALILSIGRIALGVHYLLDVVAGAGLGLLAAGIAMGTYLLTLGCRLSAINC